MKKQKSEPQKYGQSRYHINKISDFPGGSMVKNLPANAGDMGSMLGSGRSPGGEHDNLLQYSYLGNSMVRGAWWAIPHGITKELDTT